MYVCVCPWTQADAAALAVLTRIWDAALPAGASSFVLPGLVGVMGVAPAASAGKLAEGLLQVCASHPPTHPPTPCFAPRNMT
jgi:hypothetical protein